MEKKEELETMVSIWRATRKELMQRAKIHEDSNRPEKAETLRAASITYLQCALDVQVILNQDNSMPEAFDYPEYNHHDPLMELYGDE